MNIHTLGLHSSSFHTSLAALTFISTLLLLPVAVAPVMAQDVPQRQFRTYIPPSHLVSFSQNTPFNEFVEEINPVFQEVTGKQIIDPMDQTQPIGVSVTGTHFYDAFSLVLSMNELSYRETENFFMVEPARTDTDLYVDERAGQPGARQDQIADFLATLDSREIEINAILFEVNQSRARQLGIDWNVLFGEGGTTGGTGGAQQREFALRTGNLLDGLRRYYVDPPERLMFSQLTQLFRLLESDGVGETIAQPNVTVQSAEQGRIQIGSDIPIQVRDFAGNTITQFVSTGIIVDVTPTLYSQAVADTANAPIIDFIHMNVEVERSSGRPFGGSIAVDRSTATTQVILLDGEQTTIGGLYSTDVTTNRRGVPVLKDLPGWFFGLRYVFGYEENSVSQRELLIVLHAQVRDSLPDRAMRPFDTDMLDQRRDQVQEALERFDSGSSDEVRFDSLRLRQPRGQN